MGDDCPYPECGVSQIKVDAKFCWKCGKKMGPPPLTPSPLRPPAADPKEPPPSRFTGRAERQPPPAARFTKPSPTAAVVDSSNAAAVIRESGGLGRKPKFALRQGSATDDESEEPSSGPSVASAFPPARPKPSEGTSPSFPAMSSGPPPLPGSSGPPPRFKPSGDESPTVTPVPPARGKAPPRRPMGGSTTDDEGEESFSSPSVASTLPPPAFPTRPKPSDEPTPSPSPTPTFGGPPRQKGPPKRPGAAATTDDEGEESSSPAPSVASVILPPARKGPPKRADDEGEESSSPAPFVASVTLPPARKGPPKRFGAATTDDEGEEPSQSPSVAAAVPSKYSTAPLSQSFAPTKSPVSQPFQTISAFPPSRGKPPPRKQGGSTTDDEGEEPSSGPSVASAFPPARSPMFPPRPKAEETSSGPPPLAFPPPARQKPPKPSGPATDDESEEPAAGPSVASLAKSRQGPPPRSQEADSPVFPPTPTPLAINKPPPRRVNEPPPRMSPRPQPVQDEEPEARPTPQLRPQVMPKSPQMTSVKPPEDMEGGMKHIRITDNSANKANTAQRGILKKEGRLGWDTHFVQIVGRQFQYFDSEADAIANKKGKSIDLDLVANLDSQADSLTFTLEVPSVNKYESTTTWMAADVMDRMKWVGALVALRVPMKEVATTVYMAPKATAEVSHESTARILELFGEQVKKKSRKMNHFWHQRWLRVDDKAKRFAYYPTEEDAKYDLNGCYIAFTEIVQVSVPEKKNDSKQRFDFVLTNGKKTGWQASSAANAAGWFVICSKRGITVVGA